MNFLSRMLAIGSSLILLVIIFELVKRKKLKEKYALLWIVTGICILILAVSNSLLSEIARIFGIQLPINAIFFFGILFIILMNLHFSLVISELSEQNKKIAQKLALLEAEIKVYNKEG